MSMIASLDRFQRRHRVLGFPLAVVYKFFDDQGNHLAALMTYFAFLSTFPLLLLGTSILGFVLQGSPDLQQTILDSALGQFPVIGDQIGAPQGLPGSGPAVVIGAVGALYGALGIAVATQNALNVAWAVPRNHRPNPIMLRVRGLALLGVAGVTLLGTALLTALGSDIEVLGVTLGGLPRWLVAVLTFAQNAVFLTLLFRMGTSHEHRLYDDVPGAVLAAVVWQVMQLIGARFIDEVVRGSTLTNGVFALVLGLLVWIYVGAILTVLCIEVNVVLRRRLFPRALLTPFTDDVDLTDADMRAYASYANAQRTKDFATVRMVFDDDGQHASSQLAQPRDPGERELGARERAE